MAEGTDTRKLRMENTIPAYIDWLDRNMWWPQTMKPRIAMAIRQYAMNR